MGVSMPGWISIQGWWQYSRRAAKDQEFCRCSRAFPQQPIREYSESILEIPENIAARENTLLDFANRLFYLEDLIKRSSKNKNANAVTLSTIHSVKGLEWDQVYLVDLVEGIIPDRQAMELSGTNPSALEEERRLFYVGMTRAKHALTLCVPNYYVGGWAWAVPVE